MMYYPDKWVVVKMVEKDRPDCYRVFATWRGGYLSGDSWQINSGIVSVKHEDHHYAFKSRSGKTYNCEQESYGTSNWTSMVLNDLIRSAKSVGIDIELMPEDTDWFELDYKE